MLTTICVQVYILTGYDKEAVVNYFFLTKLDLFVRAVKYVRPALCPFDENVSDLIEFNQVRGAVFQVVSFSFAADIRAISSTTLAPDLQGPKYLDSGIFGDITQPYMYRLTSCF